MNPLSRLLVVGGGSAGWMAAAAIRTAAPALDVQLVESEEIGIVGVGEATIPPIRLLNRQLGIEEARFVAETNGSFKLGIRFLGWGPEPYIHPFGQYGADFDPVPLHHWWRKAREEGDTSPIEAHSLAAAAAARNRFAPPIADRARVQSTFADGRCLEADFFVDASGFRSLLLGEALGVAWLDWSNWLPADRAIAVPSSNPPALAPYTQSTARPAGWQWRIPLQHRTGNGHVFSSAFMGEDEAAAILLANLEGTPLAEPRTLRFKTGRRRESWAHNVVAVGLAAGFLEPLESTSIHLVQSAVTRLLALFPDLSGSSSQRTEYNRLTTEEWERVRDFLILHYHLTQRPEPLWRHCATTPPPDSLAHKIEQFREYGRIVSTGYELFQNPSWLAVHLGQGNMPERWDPLADHRPQTDYRARLASLRRTVAEAADAMPTHEAFIAANGMTGTALRNAA
jgi:tryptophan halogenase